MDETKVTKQNEIVDEFELELQASAKRTIGGQQANSRGKLLGLLLKKASGAESTKGRGDNLATIDDIPVRFHTAGGKHFSLNPKSEPSSLIFATYKGKATVERPLHCRIYGLRLADCLSAGRPVKSGKTERVSVSLALVGRRVRLGEAFYPAKYTEAGSVDHRMELEDLIDKLTEEELSVMMDTTTKEKIRAFVLEGREQLAPTTGTTVEALPMDVEGPDLGAVSEITGGEPEKDTGMPH